MRVLMLGWEWPPHLTGGLGVACAGLAGGLAALGVDVTFLAPALRGDEEERGVRLLDASVGGDEPGAALAPAYATAGRRLAGGAGGTPGRYGGDLMAQVARYAGRAGALAASERFDVVHGHDWTAFPAVASASERGGARVLHVHSTEHDRCPFSPHPGIVEIEQRGLAGADAVVCVSRYAAAVVASRYVVDERRMSVVHNAIDPPPAAARPRHRRIADPVVLFAGRVTAQKGPIAFLEAARRVLGVLPRARFVVAGAGDLWATAVEHAAEAGIARSVHFTGFLSKAEVERAYGEADVYVMPSASEPFGLGALEAAARGVPVVLSRNAGALEAIPSAVAADFDDPDDLADKVLACLRRPGLRAETAGRARGEALATSWRRQAARVLSVYERVRA